MGDIEFPSVWLIEDIQTFEVGKEYAETGESEGWLTYVGYFELNGITHYRFRFDPS